MPPAPRPHLARPTQCMAVYSEGRGGQLLMVIVHSSTMIGISPALPDSGRILAAIKHTAAQAITGINAGRQDRRIGNPSVAGVNNLLKVNPHQLRNFDPATAISWLRYVSGRSVLVVTAAWDRTSPIRVFRHGDRDRLATPCKFFKHRIEHPATLEQGRNRFSITVSMALASAGRL